ncbi:hypothetical protein OHA10_33450 [Kribbella sp. NBC_00662]|jgi:hypothetical protein|uniref:hypothetical protein n=1 Tax=Kribbella sp. NBC_00662 TaxID=2975969 RepID=UPI003248437F
MTFNIGNQNAANINNVGRDQHITGGQTGIVVTPEQAWQAYAELRAGIEATRLDPASSVAADKELAEVESGLRRPEPDRARIATRLERLTRLLLAAGSLASAGSALVKPIRILAQFLGVLGAPILGLLPILA